MREIKFRAWDKRENRWRGMWIFRGGHTTEQRYYDEPEIFDLSSYFKDCVLMQFTGLHDKNGKEIWEGDIIGTGFWHHAVEFRDGTFKLDNANLAGLLGGRAKIVGNIYENPELLKDGK